MVDATNPSKFPVTAFVTAPAPTAGDEQTRVDPPPVQVPALAALAVEDALAAEAVSVATEDSVATEAAVEVA